MMDNTYSLIRRGRAALNLYNVLSIAESTSFFKAVMVSFVFDDIGTNSNRQNNITEFFFGILHKRFITSKKEISIYYGMLSQLIESDIIKHKESSIFVDDDRLKKRFSKIQTRVVERIMKISDEDFARLFVQYV